LFCNLLWEMEKWRSAAKAWQIKLRIFLWVVLAGVVGWLLYMAVVPSGRISYVYDFSEPNYFIGKLTPKERIKGAEPLRFAAANRSGSAPSASAVIIGDPVYFSLRTPRRFDKATLTLKYRRPKETKSPIGDLVSVVSAVETHSNASLPVIEAGILVDKTIWRYDLKPIDNKIIDQLSLAWDVTEEDGVMLLQREKKYDSIDGFLNNLPPRNEIALYNYDLKTNFVLKDYAPAKTSSEMNYPLRGSWQFYTYVKNEDLDFVFEFSDLNKNKDSDDINLYLYYNNQVIDSRRLDDNGESENSGELIGRGKLKFKLANLPEGAYKIELRANDDIITKNIITKQKKLAFMNKLWLADGGNSGIVLYTDSREIRAQTINPGSLQTIKAGDGELVMDETYKQFKMNVSLRDNKDNTGVAAGAKLSFNEITLEKDDVILAGDGVFSFGEDSLINPKIKKVDANLNVDADGINYVLANYRIPRNGGEPALSRSNGWKVARAEFDLTKAYSEDNKYGFLISIPGLSADDEVDDYVEIKEIKIDLNGRALLEALRDKFKRR